jgi:DNA-binding MarR family transcriptional regulator
MTRLVTALEARGLVAREPDARDGRLTRIRATAAGRTLLARGRARRVAALSRRLRSLAPDDLAALEQAAAILERTLERPPRERP